MVLGRSTFTRRCKSNLMSWLTKYWMMRKVICKVFIWRSTSTWSVSILSSYKTSYLTIKTRIVQTSCRTIWSTFRSRRQAFTWRRMTSCMGSTMFCCGRLRATSTKQANSKRLGLVVTTPIRRLTYCLAYSTRRRRACRPWNTLRGSTFTTKWLGTSGSRSA